MPQCSYESKIRFRGEDFRRERKNEETALWQLESPFHVKQSPVGYVFHVKHPNYGFVKRSASGPIVAIDPVSRETLRYENG